MANDVGIIFGILVFLVGCNILIPVISSEFSNTVTSSSVSDTTGVVEGEFESGSSTTIFSVLKVIAGVLLWSFGNIWVYLDLMLFLPLRIAMYFLLARNIWPGGGG